ncbi:MAG: cysteine desulfurase [Rickettsiales bacterium]|nr:cysteine desulfurase [Rickettsiales bacterium]
MNGKRLAFLDSAASSQKPQAVIDRISSCYSDEYANIHRGLYELSMTTTYNFEAVRGKVQDFIHAKSEKEIIFVRGVTEAINLVAFSYGRHFFKKGDEVIISSLEHHANIVPWQMLREEIGIELKIIPIDDNGDLILDEYQKLFTENTKFVAVTHISNALGVINPVKEIIKIAHDHGSKTLIDGAQAAPHLKIDVQDLDADFYTFSGHKMYGPSGVGILYGKKELLDAMPPYHGGGEMIRTVTFDKTEYAETPAKFEAGTPAIAQVIGIGEAIDYLNEIGIDRITEYEHSLVDYAYKALDQIDGITLYGRSQHKASVITFNIDGVHPQDVSTILDKEGVAVRAGHHCAQPLMSLMGVSATVRASFGLYTDTQDIDQLVAALVKAKEMFL